MNASNQPRAAYLHVPFCVHRCGYCDFTVVSGRDDLIESYLTAMELEIRRTLAEPVPVSTIFIGGGTPTYLSAAALARLLQLIRQWLPLEQGGEFSIEANPAKLDAPRMEVMREFGINRVSLGVQSFQDRHLATLERDHTAGEVRRVVEILREHGFENVSLDLIYAVPNQTLEEWEQTLQAAIELGPQHISTYGLTWEKGTAFWTRREHGKLAMIPDERERTMYAASMSLLPAAGYSQYELSNFARPGMQCRHNQVYWRAEEYFGFGPGAASYRGGIRRTNHRSTTTWLRKVHAGDSAVGDEETLSHDLLAREAVMLGLRQTAGIELREYENRFGLTVRGFAPEAYDRFLEQGLLVDDHGQLRLTEEGRFLADTVVAEFL